MKKILFANIGVRNILYCGEYIEEYLKKNNKINSFRDFTQQLLNNFKEEKNKIKPIILDRLLEKINKEIYTAVLFSTDQRNVERNDQDTFYEGEILKQIFTELYPSINFINDVVKCPVFDHDQLIRTYRSRFLDHLKNFQWEKIIYCDAGGTSQQKFASKIMLEYLLNEEQLEVFYISQVRRGESEILKAARYEYRGIIDREHIRQALNIYAYPSVIQIMDAEKLSIKKPLKQFAEFLKFRFYQAYPKSESLARNLLGTNYFRTEYNLIKYSKGEPLGEYRGFEKIMDKKFFFRLCEILEVSRANSKIGNISHSILNVTQFIENYLFVILKKFGYNLRIDYDETMQRMIDECKENFENIKEFFNNKGRIKGGIPLMIEITRNFNNPTNNEILDIITKSNSFLSKYINEQNFKGLDSLRNKFAHEGEIIEYDCYSRQPYFNDINNLYNIFGLPYDIVYDEMNNKLISLL